MSDQEKEKTVEEINEASVNSQVEKAAEVMANTMHSDDEAVVSAKALLETGAHLGHL